jgi:hypothetical protein
MLKKIIFGIVIGLLAVMTATGFIYANNKDTTGKGNNKQELNKENSDEDGDLQNEENEDPNIFHITSNYNHGGIISPKGNQSVNKGDSITLTITVNSGYKLVWLRVDDVKNYNYASSTYTFTDVEKNHTIHAHFKKIKQPK